MNELELRKLKELFKEISPALTGLAESLNDYVEDESDPETKRVVTQQIQQAQELADRLDDAILNIAIFQRVPA